MRSVRFLVVLGLLLSPTVPATAADSVAVVRAKLEKIAGLRIESGRLMNGRPFFVLRYAQPADHDKLQGERFEQRITLWHKGFDRPTVLHTTGYEGVAGAFAAEPTRLVEGNQLNVEQRFFAGSTPASKDWSTLDIRQAATDHHRIVEAFKTVYAAKWLSTGASKGGMTSVYHRRFYPADVDATVAYVAPQDVVNQQDTYVDFIQRAGADETCNESLRTLQRNALYRRATLLPMLVARGEKYTTAYGSADRAFEAAVLETPFKFWQYKTPASCARIPGRTATDQQLFTFIDQIADFTSYSDAGIEPYRAYFYQASGQLNWPDVSSGTTWLKGLLHYPEAAAAPATIPNPPPHDDQAMADVDRWVRSAATRMLFVYGENDPWSAEKFEPGPGSKDCHWFTVPAGNHAAAIADLPAAQRAAATDLLKDWVSAP
ncbi:peptidase S37 [Kribbella sandramycini]|uniref:Peptidase S37 n=1 Tax=Kribbella sandramycini TaxID=60450 RepID=A0A7Y4L5F6_9ACTN|nr:S28 family serine protease [Kribbella sandramycini]MBB6566970.1 hypothetical protein [Kribbella sandramycini]NOL44692.1 peptidase S37 [Kribbella sandramycini]